MSFISIISSLFGNKAERDMKEIQPYVEQIKAVYPQIDALSNDDLRARSQALMDQIQERVKDKKNRIAELKAGIEDLEIDKREKIYDEIDKLEKEIKDNYKAVLDEILPEVFAIVKSTARRFAENETIEVTATQMDRDLAADERFDFIDIEGDKAIYHNHWTAGGNEITWDMIHYDVQLIGGVVLHQGKIAEMATGEGKTLVATLPVFLNAMTHEGVHVVTVNDYLAKRDSEWNGPIYMFHGLTVDCIDKHRPNSDERRKAYNCDITFGTNNEFGFDYLRDNMATSPMDLVQRGHNFAIVDEVDSVLIDDARTPLIISGPIPKGEDQMFDEYKHRVELLVRTQQNLTTKLLTEAKAKMGSADEKEREAGELALFRSFKGMPKNKALIKFLSEQGVKVRLQKTEEFYMQENEKNMHIATDELYFVIDEKNKSIELTDKGIDTLTGNTDDPNFFVLPDVGSEMAEVENMNLSAEEKQAKKDEIMTNYAIKSERVHTVHQLLKAYTLFEKDVDYIIDDGEVKIVDEQTGRIMEGRRWSDGLHQAVEAKENVKVEGATQTFATITLQNYFRMYNKLSGMTGTAETEAGEFWNIYKLDVVVIPTNRPIARIDMNDRIYRTKREKYNAVIDEIQKLVEAGRPVLVGTTSVEISELLSRMLKLRNIKHNVLNAKLHQQEALVVAEAGQKGQVTIATNMAGRGTDIKLSDEVKAAGGLAIIGTERHESRRVDRQLRGRSGRQGDPGSSVFFISLEDDLMRMFGSERIAAVMDRLGGWDTGEAIEHSMISNNVEKAQKKVEENNFGIRKRLIEYDDVMNQQRNVIYAKRHHALMGERIGVDITNMIYDTAESIIADARDAMDYESLQYNVLQTFAMEMPFDEDVFRSGKEQQLSNQLAEAAIENFKRRMDKLMQVANPVIQRVYKDKGSMYENILVPITDGKKVYNVAVNLKRASETDCKEVIKEFEKRTVLYVIDDEWKEHLRQLDDLKQSVQNASYEQKDPLLIYKLESFGIFQQMLDSFNRRAIAILLRGQIHQQQPDDVQRAQAQQRMDLSKYRTQKDAVQQAAQASGQAAAAGRDTREQQRPMPIIADKKPRPNDPCPCGSGKKYKQCHGAI
ncbi:MAG: preprotein translocase subunit SecA [Paludibacteraceae bacterium]|nr:preprotein translocase subunit SecA [Paludibacteraceae bacterium]